MGAVGMLRRIIRGVRRRFASAPIPPGDLISVEILDRLVALGLERSEVDALEYREAGIPYPDGWRRRGNRLYVAPGVRVATDFIVGNAARSSLSNVVVVLGSPIDNLAAFGVHGDGATVYIGQECWLPSAQVHCGAESSVIFRRLVTCTFAGHIDARNGGSVFADTDQLWASRVYIATDDMHALLDADSGERLNTFGGHIRIESHVWLGQEAVVTGGASIGENSVIGMRSLVRNGTFPSGAVLAGTPARVVRSGVTWDRRDIASHAVRD
jgi:hypothetical protein